MKFIKKYKIHILSFIIPIILFIIMLTIGKKAPFGKHIIMMFDGSLQYPGFSSILSEVLHGNANLFYSFKGGLGFNFYACCVYYLFNPTNILLLFFNSTNLEVFYLITVILKIGLCGLTMSILLNYKSPKNKYNIIFSIAFALCTYNLVYYYNFMWFDSIILFPIVLLGIERLIKSNKKALYLITLTLSIISNFYIGYMICIFSLLYFIYKYILLSKEKRNIKIIKSFLISSLLSGLMSAFVLLPVSLELFQGKASMYSNNNYTNYFEFDKDALTSIYKLTPGSFNNKDISYGGPNIYCSLFVLVLCMYYFLNKNISKKDKLLTSIFIGIFIFGFSFNLFDFGWQLFQRPIWYQVRYGFIFNVLLILVAHKAFINMDGPKNKNISILIGYLTLLILIIVGAVLSGLLKDIGFNADIIFLILSIFLLVQYIFIFNNKSIIYFSVFLFIIEIMSNGIYNFKILSNFKTTTEYRNGIAYEKEAVDKIKSIEKENSFYRMDMKKMMVINSGMVHSYNGINYFSSLRNQGAMDILGYFGSKIYDGCSARATFDNPIVNSILGIKYIISENEEFYYQYIPRNTKSEKKVYKNKDALSLGYLVNNNINNLKFTTQDVLKNTESFIKNSTNTNDNIYTLINTFNLENTINMGGVYYKENKDNDAYVVYETNNAVEGFYIINNNAKSNFIYAYLNDKEYKLDSSDTSLYASSGDKLTIKFSIGSSPMNTNDITINLLPSSTYKNFIETMKNNQMNIIEYKTDRYIRSKVLVTDENSLLMTTIPYDKGWKILVDGKETGYHKILNSFIGINLTKGEHTIEFKFFPRGLKLGLLISITSFITTIIYLCTGKKKKK
ncbi:MAG: YfhO family protein [Bacilli bacterium]